MLLDPLLQQQEATQEAFGGWSSSAAPGQPSGFAFFHGSVESTDSGRNPALRVSAKFLAIRAGKFLALWMGNHNGHQNNHGNQYSNQFHNKEGTFMHPHYPSMSPSTPLLGMSPLDTNRPFFTNQTPIRFNLNGNRKTIPQNENPLLSNNGNAKKKRKKNKANQNGSDDSSDAFPPLPDHPPPPLPPCPPPEIPKPPPPPLDVPLPPPLPEDSATLAPQPPADSQDNSEKLEETSNVTNNNYDSSSFLQSSSVCKDSVGTWPESLERYIKRCYEKCKTSIDRDQIDICLKGRITAAANKDEIWTRNWDAEPIPSVHSERNNLSVKTVRGTLSLYQKLENNNFDKTRTKVGVNNRSNGHRSSPLRRRRPHSRSRSKSSSPLRKRHSSSPSSNGEVEQKVNKNNKGKNKSKLSDRLSLNTKKSDKNVKAAKKRSPCNQFSLEDVQGNAEKLQKRAARFGNSSNVPTIASSLQPNNKKRPEPTMRRPIINDSEGDYELSNMHIVGTSLEIEKSFLRLTKAPEACEVRPVAVLKSSLRNVKEKWIEKQDYRYACDQLKSIRQDLTVQGVRDGFTVEVYETHARIALEKGDHEEFNQCQTQLKMLYSELPECRANAPEFTAYRILYYIFTKNTLDLTTIFQFLSKEEHKNECIHYALETRRAWATGNLHKFFMLYRTAPLMAGYLMDWFVDREREVYLKYIIKSRSAPASAVESQTGVMLVAHNLYKFDTRPEVARPLRSSSHAAPAPLSSTYHRTDTDDLAGPCIVQHSTRGSVSVSPRDIDASSRSERQWLWVLASSPKSENTDIGLDLRRIHHQIKARQAAGSQLSSRW
ncbi:Leukocyte receptor cluster member 8 homolog [Eumeta japonica]|uniref:Leukocyte receptor cluster member 8 homolog n=1 Tax=Eumeta variegata TaxID=151549 RepID=A0A4C1U1U8_EUMVA|nr:Leukocyte receptor cluster member 8 homolog [Eumeta japonica]